MSFVNFNDLPDTARVWIFGAENPLDSSQVQKLTENMGLFLEQWTAHKSELNPSWELRLNQFIVVGLDESMLAASGCSIDSMVHNLKNFESAIGANIVGTSLKVFYRDKNESIQCVGRAEFKQLVENGSVNEETVVFNNMIQTAADLRQNRWEIPMQESWHMQAFGVLV